MSDILLGVGSNIDRKRNILHGIEALTSLLDDLQCSPVYETSAVGFSGESFFNLVVAAKTSLPLEALSAALKEIEYSFGREPQLQKYTSRTLDIDILTYDELVGCFNYIDLPRDEITKHAFVLRPLADIAPHRAHPVLKKTYFQLWSQFKAADQLVLEADFSVNHMHS
ncbi:MAG: 2-amino-4-hydroxy-6-hydroxymethyldihydropteridine diphosphokinase [Lentisphaeria bacterium]|jgi:2-amino-4-hydroxy-6-hydroxymethyldihydropteridine diphosphokinase